MLVKALKDFTYRANPGNRVVIAKKGEEVDISGCEYLSRSKKGLCVLVENEKTPVAPKKTNPQVAATKKKPKKDE